MTIENRTESQPVVVVVTVNVDPVTGQLQDVRIDPTAKAGSGR